MSQITLQGKQRALIRVAESRVAVLDAATASKEHVSRCVNALPVSPATLKRVGVMAGAAASVMGVLAGLRKRSKSAEKKVEQGGTSAVSFVAQLLLPLILPALQRSLQKVLVNQDMAARGQKIGF
ncbi:MAG: hypothetical protein IKV13_04835 [Akkermansia sp.]|nr:hypothetical protein [Akkermansia sp.]